MQLRTPYIALRYSKATKKDLESRHTYSRLAEARAAYYGVV